MTDHLHTKLDPARFPNMSGQMAAIIGLRLDRPFTDPVLAELIVTPDGAVLGRLEGQADARVFIGAVTDLRANLRRLGMAAELDEPEWLTLSQRVQQRLGLERGARG